VNYDTPYYMLELSGLGSEAARHGNGAKGSVDWMDELARRHDVGLAMLFDDATPRVPAGWQPLARLRLRQRVVSAAGSVVTFYAVQPEEAARILQGLHDMAPTLPRGAELEFITTTQ
jgi:hypothetical protein